jgi:WD40 repeat protein
MIPSIEIAKSANKNKNDNHFHCRYEIPNGNYKQIHRFFICYCQIMSLYLATAPGPAHYGYVIHIYDATTHVLMGTMAGHSGHITFLGFATNGLRLASCSEDFTVRVWDAGMLTELVCLVLEEEMGIPLQALFSPDGNSLITTSVDGIVRVWNLQARMVIMTAVGEEHSSLHSTVFCQDNMSIVVSASRYDMEDDANTYMLRVLAVPTGDVQLELSSPETFAHAVTCVPGHDKLLAVANDYGGVVLLDRETGTIFKSFNHNYAVRALCVSGNGTELATCGANGTIIVWDIRSGNQLQWFNCFGAYKLSLNRAGNRVCCTGPIVRIVDVATGETIYTLPDMNHGCYSDAVSILM